MGLELTNETHKRKGDSLKTIRLEVARRYLQRYGGELEGEKGGRTMSAYIGIRPQKVIPFFGDMDIYLTDVHQYRIAKVINLPTETGYLYARTGAFRPEIAY